jgi:hypothetical protein
MRMEVGGGKGKRKRDRRKGEEQEEREREGGVKGEEKKRKMEYSRKWEKGIGEENWDLGNGKRIRERRRKLKKKEGEEVREKGVQ